MNINSPRQVGVEERKQDIYEIHFISVQKKMMYH